MSSLYQPQNNFSCKLKRTFMAKLVYIGGFGRSGSTLLEYLLTCEPELVACGEVVRHVRRQRTRKACTCGQPAAQCPVWGPFQLARHAEPLDHETLTLAIFAQVSPKFHTMIESSKTAWGSALMPFRFRSRLDKDFLLIHIVRDPRAVCWSTIKSVMSGKQNKRLTSPLVRCLKTTVGWTVANLACEIFGLIHPDNYVRVRYEDLVKATRPVIDQICGKLLFRSHAPLEEAGTRNNRHQLYGNAMRFKSLSPSSLSEDAAWKEAMPKPYRLVAALAWPLAAKYGYFKPQLRS
jgi:hypothetical protein